MLLCTYIMTNTKSSHACAEPLFVVEKGDVSMQSVDTMVYVRGQLVRKSEAMISVYDSGFMHGDGVYEGIRLYREGVLLLSEHIRRLYDSAKTLDINVGISQTEMEKIVLRTFAANDQRENLHMRLMVTRGLKWMTGMNPKYNIGEPSIVALVDYKEPIYDKSGIILATSPLMRTRANFLDPKIHSMNQLGQILASIDGNRFGADEAIMLDYNGFVAETNGTTMFMIRDDVIYTPTVDFILPGLTRYYVIKWAREEGFNVIERNLSLHEFYNADEVFISGTVGEIVPVSVIDGRKIGNETPGKMTQWLMKQHQEKRSPLCVPVPYDI